MTQFRDKSLFEEELKKLIARVKELEELGYEYAQKQDILEEKEKYFRQLFEEAPLSYQSLDADGIIQEVNLKWTSTFGYDEKEVLGQWFGEFLTSDSKQKFKECYLQATCGNRTCDTKYDIVSKSGEVLHVEFSCQRAIDINGNFIQMHCILNNITEQVKMYNAVIESENLFRATFEHAGIGMAICDLNGKFVRTNKAFSSMLGYEDDELLKKTFLDITPQRDIDRSEENFKKVINSEEKHGQIQKHYIKKDGTEIIVWLTVSISLTAAGEPAFAVIMAEDISERTKTADALKDSEEKYRSLFQSANDAIFLMDKDRFVDCNEKTFKLFGCTKEQIINHPPYEYSPEYQPDGRTSQDKALEKINKALEGEPQFFEWTHCTHAKVNFDAEVSLTRIKLSGKYFLLAIIRDISERKMAQQRLIEAKNKAEQSDKLKSEFLAQMSHEIRTPINAILSFTSLVESEYADDATGEMKTSFDIIKSAGRRIIRTIDLLLNMSEMQQGIYDYVPVDTDVFGLLAGLYEQFIRVMKNDKIDLRLKKHTDNAIVLADEYTVNQIFDNLIDNALKYTDEGKVEVIVKRNEHKQLQVVVADTGIGISEEYLPNLFKPFTQEDSGYTRKYEGNGLGMALVKQYCDLNNADISVESVKGEGTEFTVTFKSF